MLGRGYPFPIFKIVEQSLLSKQRQSGNIRFTVGQYWLIRKRNGSNYVNFVVNLVMYGKGV
jgi:hypothetical protein